MSGLDHRTEEQRKKEQERLRLLEQYEKDQNRFVQELEGLDRALQDEADPMHDLKQKPGDKNTLKRRAKKFSSTEKT